MPPFPFPQVPDMPAQILDSRAAIPEAAPASQRRPVPEDLTLRLLLTQRAPVDENGNLFKRQSNGIFNLQETYAGLNAGPAPGAVVGIVLGSVAGFLLLIWLLWTLSNGTTFIRTSGELEEVDEVRVRPAGSQRSRRPKSRRPEMVSRSGSPPRRVYRSERITREYGDRSVSPSVARSRDRSRIRERETIIVDERVPGDDIIEVMEEHSSVDAPRRKSRRSDRSRY